jgi:putative transposase
VFLQQAVRTMTAADDGLLVQHRVLICDRDTKWSAPVRARLEEAGIRVVQTPYQAPNANAYAERFVRSIKEECLKRLIPIGERHFRRAVTEYVAHNHHERNHQGIENTLIEGASVGEGTIGRIRRRPRLGGLLNYYDRAA